MLVLHLLIYFISDIYATFLILVFEFNVTVFCTIECNFNIVYHFQIWWLSPEYRHDVRNIAPGFKQVYHNEQDMNADGGGFLNMKYSSLNAREIR